MPKVSRAECKAPPSPDQGDRWVLSLLTILDTLDTLDQTTHGCCPLSQPLSSINNPLLPSVMLYSFSLPLQVASSF